MQHYSRKAIYSVINTDIRSSLTSMKFGSSNVPKPTQRARNDIEHCHRRRRNSATLAMRQPVTGTLTCVVYQARSYTPIRRILGFPVHT